MAATKYNKIDYEKISIEELADEVLKRPAMTMQMAINRFKKQEKQHLIDKIQKARKLAQIKRIQQKLDEIEKG